MGGGGGGGEEDNSPMPDRINIALWRYECHQLYVLFHTCQFIANVTLLFALSTACQFYWQFNHDAPRQTGFLPPESFRVLLSDIMFNVYIIHIASNSLVSKVSKIVPTFFMMSEERWMADENIV